MNKRKPTECSFCQPWGKVATEHEEIRRLYCGICAGTGKLYAIPDTHRVVSVELLRLAHSECFKNFSSSDSKTVASQLRAIINKEQKE